MAAPANLRPDQLVCLPTLSRRQIGYRSRPQVSQCIILYLDSEFLCCAPDIPSAMVMETVVQHPYEFINPSDEF